MKLKLRRKQRTQEVLPAVSVEKSGEINPACIDSSVHKISNPDEPSKTSTLQAQMRSENYAGGCMTAQNQTNSFVTELKVEMCPRLLSMVDAKSVPSDMLCIFSLLKATQDIE